MDKKSKILVWCMFGGIALSMLVSFVRYVAYDDYLIFTDDTDINTLPDPANLISEPGAAI